MEIIVGIVFTPVGLLFLVLTAPFIRRAGRRFYRPRVEFNAHDGRTVTFAASIGSNRRSYRIGDCLNLLLTYRAAPPSAGWCFYDGRA